MRHARCPLFSTLALAAFGLLCSAPASAQTSNRPPTGAAATPPAPVISPEILADQRVTFRLRAPKASAVSVSGQFQQGSAPMTKDEHGLWSATVGPVPSGVHEYSFNVDGLSMIDPGNRAIKPMRNPRTSILDVPGTPPALHDFQEVPHGRVSLLWYRSKSLARVRPLQVYTPPGYDDSVNASVRWPTLFLFHGSGDNEATWVAHGHAHWILDNLIAQRRAQPMIIVMLDGHAVPPGGATDRNANSAAFERDLLEDAMPFVAANFRTRDEAAQRAIIGLSMGGGQSMTIGLKHPERFAWVGGMSSSVRNTGDLLGDGAALNRQLKLLWFACGKDDGLIKANQDLAAALKEKNVRHTFLETQGNHSWPVWRKYLADFLPLIFRETKS